MSAFDDARLEAPEAAADAALRHLAQTGARLRREAVACADVRVRIGLERPRAVVAVGAEARLVRAVLEPTCPVPFVAWSGAGLPGWVGPLDIVVVLAADRAHDALAATVTEAAHRGSRLIVAARQDSEVAQRVPVRDNVVTPMTTGDPLAAVIVVLEVLHAAGLGPEVDIERVATVADQVAEQCSPLTELGTNPAKDIACGLADGQPLVWGGSVLAARASRRIAEAARAACGRVSLAADAGALLPLLAGAGQRDVFADPIDDAGALRPVLVMLDDGLDGDARAADRQALHREADAHDVRTCEITAYDDGVVERYVSLLQRGLYAAAYLAIGVNCQR